MISDNSANPNEINRLKIKIYGVGKLCKRSKMLERNLRQALKELGVKADMEVIVDIPRMVNTDVRYLPALNVNGRTILHGAVLTVPRLKKRLKPFLELQQTKNF